MNYYNIFPPVVNIKEIDHQGYNVIVNEELGATMAACQKFDQDVTRHRHHHVCRFDCNRDGDNTDENEDANDIHQRRSNLRALMIVSTLIGIVSSFFTYLLPFIICDADKITTPVSVDFMDTDFSDASKNPVCVCCKKVGKNGSDTTA